MEATRRAFLTFAIALSAISRSDAGATESAQSAWRSVDVFVDHCLRATPSPEEMTELALQLGWTPLSDQAMRDLTLRLGVIPGVHHAWRIGEAPHDIVVEVGGVGAWSFGAQDEAQRRGEPYQGPLPGVAEPGADGRFGFSNHWTCNVHFRGGDPDAIVERLLEESVRTSPLGAPLTRHPDLENRPGWSAVDWFLSSERSIVSFTFRRDEAAEAYTRELHLGFFTAFDAEKSAIN